MRPFLARLAQLFHRRAADEDMQREMAAHLRLLQDDFERRGLSPEDARLAARRTYGGVEQAKELHRDARSFVWFEHRRQDIRYAFRNLLRTPAFTAVAILTLALGIGANTAIFSVVNAVLLRPLAYHDADRLVTVLHGGDNPVAPANYHDWREQTHSFTDMAAAQYWSPNLTHTDPPEHLLGLQLTSNMLPMLGVSPLLGRVFTTGEDTKGNDHKIILSHRLWLRRFGGDPAILEKTLILDGEPYTIIGVMPPEFRFAPFWATRAELWAPLSLADRLQARGGNSLRVFARLRPDVSLTQARTDVATVTARLEQQYPGSNRNVVVTPLKENVTGKVQTPLLMVLGAVAFVLLIACANVAHMLLARTSDRQKEIAVRTAIGASRSRVIGQFFTENLVLATFGAAAGLAFALIGLKALTAAAPAFLPRVDSITIDARVGLFLLGVTLFTTLAFGLVPALHAAAGNLSEALKEGGRSGTGGAHRQRLRSILITSEFALAFMLLIGAGLMARSFLSLQSVNPGFNPHGVLSLVVSVAGSNESAPPRRALFYRELLEKVRALPGVESVGAINHLPLVGDEWGWSFLIQGRPEPRPGEEPIAVYRLAAPGYFETMRLPLRRGRAITAQDDARAPGVVIINERAASEYWPGQDPIGQRISFDSDEKTHPPTWLTIIGIAANAKQSNVAERPGPEVYLSAFQNPAFLGEGSDSHSAYLTLVVRTAATPADLVPTIKNTVWSIDHNLPISQVVTMDSAVADSTAQPRFETFLLTVFATVALLLAAVGIYGVMNYAVARRTKEIGIRMSLGATQRQVLGLVLGQGLTQALTGTALGLTGALLLARLMKNMLYGVEPGDPLTFLAVAFVLGATALLASGIPARKATRIEPVIALRAE